MKADKAGSKFQPLDTELMKYHNFRKCLMVIISGILYRLDTSSEKFLIFVLSGLKLNDLAITVVGTKRESL